MNDATTPQKATPSRRRNGRHYGRPAGQKAYASENDVPSLTALRQEQTPRTPHKIVPASSPAPTPAHGEGSKQRKKAAKPKSSNLLMSPGNKDPSPHGSGPARAGAGADPAFAGATFHASPAPSALPIPSFLSKSSSDSPLSKKSVFQEPSPPATDAEVPTPSRPFSAPRNHDSPLDFMFRAHREQKLREMSSAEKSSVHTNHLVSPPSSLADVCTSPSSTSRTRRSHLRQTLHGIDSFELDGCPRDPLGPAFATPYQERIKAARISRSNLIQGMPKHVLEPTAEDPTEALKRFLFGDSPLPIMASSEPNSLSIQSDSEATEMDEPGLLPSNNLRAMEDDLRRILRLDQSSEASGTGSRLFTP